jgi:predicted secreted protein
MVIVRNANADNFNGTITVINANSFSVDTVNSGASSGSSAAYSLGFTSSSVSVTGSTIVAPANGDVQLMSMLISDAMTGTYTLTTPQSSLNGAGQNDTIYNSYAPVWRVYTSGGATVTGATLSLTGTPNVFVWAAMSTGDRNIRAQF